MLSPARCAHHLRLFEEELIHEFAEACESQDLIGVLDSLMDSLVVIFHAIVEFGFAPVVTSAFTEVDQSNLTKLPPLEPGGKLVKGAKYNRPDLLPIVAKALGVSAAAEHRTSIGEELLAVAAGTKQVGSNIWSLSTVEAITFFHGGVGFLNHVSLFGVEAQDLGRVFVICDQSSASPKVLWWVTQIGDLVFHVLPATSTVDSEIAEDEWEAIAFACLP